MLLLQDKGCKHSPLYFQQRSVAEWKWALFHSVMLRCLVLKSCSAKIQLNLKPTQSAPHTHTVHKSRFTFVFLSDSLCCEGAPWMSTQLPAPKHVETRCVEHVSPVSIQFGPVNHAFIIAPDHSSAARIYGFTLRFKVASDYFLLTLCGPVGSCLSHEFIIFNKI